MEAEFRMSLQALGLADPRPEGGGICSKAEEPAAAAGSQQGELAEAAAPAVAARALAPTTLMLRKLPNGLTRDELQGALEGIGLAGTFDFLYLPIDQGTRHRHHGIRTTPSNVGYAFVNFIDSYWAAKCEATVLEEPSKLLASTRFQRASKSKVVSVSVAHVQGLEANLAHYARCAVMHAAAEEFRPLILPGGTRGGAATVGAAGRSLYRDLGAAA
jgi:hypothetical protein